MTTQTRRMNRGDLVEVGLLSGELGYPLDAAEALHRFEALSPEKHGLFVAEDSGHVVGWIHVSAEESLTDEPKSLIDALIVGETSRSRGIGRLLVAEAESWASARGHRTLRVRTRVTRERAHDFYRRAGFVLDKTQHVFDKNLAGGRKTL
ncbi:MAG TPA: GNAT family N-acetyltransferase [Thermoanaerobaculia bacterium]